MPLLLPKMLQIKKRTFNYLDNLDVRYTIRSVTATIHLNVFKPLDVRLCITVDLTMELGVSSNYCCNIGWKTGLQDRPMRRAL